MDTSIGGGRSGVLGETTDDNQATGKLYHSRAHLCCKLKKSKINMKSSKNQSALIAHFPVKH